MNKHEQQINHTGDAGITLIETLVSILLSTLIIGASLTQYFHTTWQAHDNEVRTETEELARTIADRMAFDIRMIGAGMPLGQDGFPIGGVGLSDAPLPVLTSSTTTELYMRMNERGERTVLTADFDADSDNDIAVSDASDFDVGDTIYISNLTVGGDDGVEATITSVVSDTIDLATPFIATAGVVFEAGSVVNRVTELTYDGAATDGISRQDATVTVTLAPGSSFVIEYVDESGNTLTPPLAESVIGNNLAGIVLTVSVDSQRRLKDGSTYTATAEQSIVLRNLLISRSL